MAGGAEGLRSWLIRFACAGSASCSLFWLIAFSEVLVMLAPVGVLARIRTETGEQDRRFCFAWLR